MEIPILISHNESKRLIIFLVFVVAIISWILFLDIPVGSKLIFISAVLAYAYVMNYNLVLNYELYPSVLKATQIVNFKKVIINIQLDKVSKVEIKITRGSTHFNIYFIENNENKKFSLAVGKYIVNKYKALTIIEALMKYDIPVYFTLFSWWGENKVKNDLSNKGWYINQDSLIKRKISQSLIKSELTRLLNI